MKPSAPEKEGEMNTTIGGLHHVTMIADDPQRNVDFYTGVLGLRLVKQTVNYDDPGTYHFYYADAIGTPGTVLTFFPMPGAYRGWRGYGQTTAIGLSIPMGTLAYWRQRLAEYGATVTEGERFGQHLLAFEDPDGLLLELVEDGNDGRAPWNNGGVEETSAVRGVHHVTLTEKDGTATADLLAAMGYHKAAEEGSRARWEVAAGGAGTYVDVVVDPDAPRGQVAAGQVHHVAFRTPDDGAQRAWLDTLRRLGRQVSPVMERQYFHSIYFREPGGVLFEIATEGPGFLVDESYEDLGTGLRLPEMYERQRMLIETALPKIDVPRLIPSGGALAGPAPATGLPLKPEAVDADLPELQHVG
jgi:glyoxalase family protein